MYPTQAFFGKKKLNLSLNSIIKQAEHKNNDVFANKLTSI